MNITPTTYDQLEANFIAWAQDQADIRAAVVIGSRARAETAGPGTRPDEWSDLDLIVFITEPAVYAQDEVWLSELGVVWLAHHNITFSGDAEWLTLFANGLKADFVLARASGSLQAMIDQSPYQAVLRRGLRVVLNKDGPKTDLTLPTPQSESPAPPTPAEFTALINHAWLTATRTARLLKRGELWQAKAQVDTVFKDRLLTMLEWHIQVKYGLERDTWYEGRYLKQWAEPDILAEIPATFARYQVDDLWRALSAGLTLFRRLATETAERLQYPYPTMADEHITSWLESIAD